MTSYIERRLACRIELRGVDRVAVEAGLALAAWGRARAVRNAARQVTRESAEREIEQRRTRHPLTLP